MPENYKQFKRPPKKYEPKGMTILFEDRDIIVIDKSSGLLSMGNDKEQMRTAFTNLTDYVCKGNYKSKHRVFIVHRLDRETSGVLVFAKTLEVKQFLQETWHEFEKTYFAVVHGHMPEDEGSISSYLVEHGINKMYSATNPEQKKKGKLATTCYKVLRQNDDCSLLELKILSGRKHQIRVHLADKGCPIIGDKKYASTAKGGKKARRLALHAAELAIKHPFSKKDFVIKTPVPPYFESLVRQGKG